MAKITAVTATPILFVESVVPGKSGLRGWVGSYAEDGTPIGEANAYCYVFVDGFNINPPDVNNDGSFRNIKTAIVSDINGYWKTDNLFFDSVSNLKVGQSLVIRAKAPYKLMSERSFPYNIGGTPVPIELGINENGILRAPFIGESSVTGRISYWFNSIGPAIADIGKPNFDTENHVYVYVDGVNVLSTESKAGEVLKNEIRGTNAVYPLNTNIEHSTLSLLVDNQRVDVSLENIRPLDSGPIVGIQDSINNRFTFQLPDAQAGVMIFLDGIRLREGLDNDYVYSINSNLQANLFFVIPPTALNKLVAVFQYNMTNIILGEIPSPTKYGDDTYSLAQVPKPDTLRLFKNGVLLDPFDIGNYTLEGSYIIFNADQVPEAGDVLLADYQLLSNNKQLIYSQHPIGIIDGIQDTFAYISPSDMGNIHIFKNGIKQIEGINDDYVLNEIDFSFKFNFWSIPKIDEEILVQFYIAPATLNQLISLLNNKAEFKYYGIKAEIFNNKPLTNASIPVGDHNLTNRIFTLSTTGNVNIRLFKEGYRLKEEFPYSSTGDFTFNRNTSTITTTNSVGEDEILIALINYATADFIIGETPSGAMNGSNDTFTLSSFPKITAIHVYKNGLRLNPSTNKYQIIQNTIKLTTPPSSSDILIVDYEIFHGAETNLSTLTYIQPTPVGIGLLNSSFSFPAVTPGTAVTVFQNGRLVSSISPSIKYILNGNSVQFSPANINDTDALPAPGDEILIDFNRANLFTTIPNDQIKISSNYTLELLNNDILEQALFGTDGATLYPGKDEEGNFRFYISTRTGYWRWTWYDPVTEITTEFKSGQHITARAKNDTPFIYTTEH